MRWIVVDLEEDAVDACGHRRARQHRNELRLSAADTSASAEGVCTECVPSNTTGANARMMGSERISTTRLL